MLTVFVKITALPSRSSPRNKLHFQVIGRSLVLEDELKAIHPCPICHEKCKNPVALSCEVSTKEM